MVPNSSGDEEYPIRKDDLGLVPKESAHMGRGWEAISLSLVTLSLAGAVYFNGHFVKSKVTHETNSPPRPQFSYHPVAGSGDGLALIEGYARTQIEKAKQTSSTGLVEKIEDMPVVFKADFDKITLTLEDGNSKLYEEKK